MNKSCVVCFSGLLVVLLPGSAIASSAGAQLIQGLSPGSLSVPPQRQARGIAGADCALLPATGGAVKIPNGAHYRAPGSDHRMYECHDGVLRRMTS